MPKKNDLFIDTSRWAYYLDRLDPLHPKVVTIVQGVVLQRRHLVTTNYIITELVALLSSRFHLPRKEVIKAMNAFKSDAAVEIVHIDASMDNQAWKLLEARSDKEWSLVDASSFVLMQQFGITEALTTDHHFTQAGFIKLL
jgi:predicted nucleic acid-binding protein